MDTDKLPEVSSRENVTPLPFTHVCVVFMVVTSLLLQSVYVGSANDSHLLSNLGANTVGRAAQGGATRIVKTKVCQHISIVLFKVKMSRQSEAMSQKKLEKINKTETLTSSICNYQVKGLYVSKFSLVSGLKT